MRLIPGTVLTVLVSLSHGWVSTAQPQVPRMQLAVDTNSNRTPPPPLTGKAMPCANGRIKDFECQNVELLSYLPSEAMGNGGLFDTWGWHDSATGREFVAAGGWTGISFVEVTDPLNPKYLGKLPFHDNDSLPGAGIAGVKVYKNHAFITSEVRSTQGLQVFDLTQLRDVKNAPVVFRETAHYTTFGSAHTLALNEATGFAYAAGSISGDEPCGSGLHMVDVRTPTKPTFAGCFSEPNLGSGYVHDAQCVVYHGPDQQYKGREICIMGAVTGLGIADVTDKQHPKTISTATYPNVGYAHQGWFTEDQRYFFLGDEEDDGAGGINKTRTIVFDLEDLDQPTVLTEFYGTNDATDHNLYIRGHYMYQSNYHAGLRIIDIADAKNPKEVGYLDTAPEWSGPGMELGSWGNYPFLKNNVVAVANMGLFLVRLK
jgi:choice-of-anchor B domain-containing protein